MTNDQCGMTNEQRGAVNRVILAARERAGEGRRRARRRQECRMASRGSEKFLRNSGGNSSGT